MLQHLFIFLSRISHLFSLRIFVFSLKQFACSSDQRRSDQKKPRVARYARAQSIECLYKSPFLWLCVGLYLNEANFLLIFMCLNKPLQSHTTRYLRATALTPASPFSTPTYLTCLTFVPPAVAAAAMHKTKFAISKYFSFNPFEYFTVFRLQVAHIFRAPSRPARTSSGLVVLLMPEIKIIKNLRY